MRDAFMYVEDGALVKFRPYWVFHCRNTRYSLQELRILEDGRFYFEDTVCTLEIIQGALQEGKIRTSIEDGKRLSIPGLTGFWLKEPIQIVEEPEFLKEVNDILCELNGKPTTSDRCRSAFREFQREPSDENRERLRIAYEAVPKHLDCWLLGFEDKDIPIRQAIWGEDFGSH